MYFLTPLLPSCFLYWHIDGGEGGAASAVVDGVDTEKYATEELFRWADIINCNSINYVHTMSMYVLQTNEFLWSFHVRADGCYMFV